MSEVQKFAPTVMVDGRVVQPAGWMWVVGFALGGCEWAIREADTPEFKEKVRQSLLEQRKENIEEEIQRLEKRIAVLKLELRLH